MPRCNSLKEKRCAQPFSEYSQSCLVFALVLVYGLQNDEYYTWSAPFLVFALMLVYGLQNEELILHLECAFLGFCACFGLWFIERGINITLGVRLSWFLRLCCFMVYRTRNKYYIWSVPFLVFALVLVYGLQNEEYYSWSAPLLPCGSYGSNEPYRIVP